MVSEHGKGSWAVCEAGITNRGLYINKAVDNTKIKMGKKAGSTRAVQKQKKRKPISSQKQKIQ